jgi:hypothetical protein
MRSAAILVLAGVIIAGCNKTATNTATPTKSADTAQFTRWKYHSNTQHHVDEMTGRKWDTTTNFAYIDSKQSWTDKDADGFGGTSLSLSFESDMPSTKVKFARVRISTFTGIIGSNMCMEENDDNCSFRIKFDDRLLLSFKVRMVHSPSTGTFASLVDTDLFLSELKKAKSIKIETPFLPDNHALIADAKLKISDFNVENLTWEIAK